MEGAAFWVLGLMVVVGLPQVLAFAAARALRRFDPRMLSWPPLAVLIFGGESWAFKLRASPPADGPEVRCGTGPAIVILAILTFVGVNLIMGCLLRAIHLAVEERQARASAPPLDPPA